MLASVISFKVYVKHNAEYTHLTTFFYEPFYNRLLNLLKKQYVCLTCSCIFCCAYNINKEWLAMNTCNHIKNSVVKSFGCFICCDIDRFICLLSGWQSNNLDRWSYLTHLTCGIVPLSLKYFNINSLVLCRRMSMNFFFFF